jgi:long-chain acyl-CoA synthetase
MKQALFKQAVATKIKNLRNSSTYTHPIYDKLIFNKFREKLGGKVSLMGTGTATISKDILDFSKVAFCCPILETYG